jgi:hypothetical protein
MPAVEILTQGRHRAGDRAATDGHRCAYALLVRFALADSDAEPLGAFLDIFNIERHQL